MSGDRTTNSRDDGLNQLQLEALGITRRNKITTDAFKEDSNQYCPVSKLEAARKSHKGTPAAKAKVTAWNTVHEAIGDDGTVTQDLGPVNEGLGQTHRAKLQADIKGHRHGGNPLIRSAQEKLRTSYAKIPQGPSASSRLGKGRVAKGSTREDPLSTQETKALKPKTINEPVKDIQQKSGALKRSHPPNQSAPLVGPEDFLEATKAFQKTRVDSQSAASQIAETRRPSPKASSVASDAPSSTSLSHSVKSNIVPNLIDLDFGSSNLDHPALMPTPKPSPPMASDLPLLLSILTPEQLHEYLRLKAKGTAPDETLAVSELAGAARETPSDSKGKSTNDEKILPATSSSSLEAQSQARKASQSSSSATAQQTGHAAHTAPQRAITGGKGKSTNDENINPAISASSLQERPQALKAKQSSSSISTQRSGLAGHDKSKLAVIIGEHVFKDRFELPHEGLLVNRFQGLSLNDANDDIASIAVSEKDKTPTAGIPATIPTTTTATAAGTAATTTVKKATAKETVPPHILRQVAEREPAAPAPPSSTFKPFQMPPTHAPALATANPFGPASKDRKRPSAPALPAYLQGAAASGKDAGAAARKQYGGF